MKDAKISIIVPVYNVPEKFLRQCIESCLGQTMHDIEVIAVDDGSTDGDSGKILDEYAAKDARLKVIHKPNGGLVSARNAGYEAVTAPWHMYLDGDDFIDLDTCEILMKEIDKHGDVDIIFWNVVHELGDRSITGKWEWSCDEDSHLYEGEAECRELSRNVLIYKSGIATAYSKLINTEFARRNGLNHNPSLRQGMEGTEFSLRAFYHAKRALFLKRYLNHYVYNDNSISKASNERNTAYLAQCCDAMNDFIESLPEKDEFKKALYQRIVYMLIASAMSTYFHPSCEDSLSMKCKKYKNAIKSNPLFCEAVKKASTDGIDKMRRVAFGCIKLGLYPALQLIASAKYGMLKRGKFDY